MVGPQRGTLTTVGGMVLQATAIASGFWGLNLSAAKRF
jgi:Mg2+ and Co2+ transporter CorA